LAAVVIEAINNGRRSSIPIMHPSIEASNNADMDRHRRFVHWDILLIDRSRVRPKTRDSGRGNSLKRYIRKRCNRGALKISSVGKPCGSVPTIFTNRRSPLLIVVILFVCKLERFRRKIADSASYGLVCQEVAPFSCISENGDRYAASASLEATGPCCPLTHRRDVLSAGNVHFASPSFCHTFGCLSAGNCRVIPLLGF